MGIVSVCGKAAVNVLARIKHWVETTVHLAFESIQGCEYKKDHEMRNVYLCYLKIHHHFLHIHVLMIINRVLQAPP